MQSLSSLINPFYGWHPWRSRTQSIMANNHGTLGRRRAGSSRRWPTMVQHHAHVTYSPGSHHSQFSRDWEAYMHLTFKTTAMLSRVVSNILVHKYIDTEVNKPLPLPSLSVRWINVVFGTKQEYFRTYFTHTLCLSMVYLISCTSSDLTRNRTLIVCKFHSRPVLGSSGKRDHKESP